MLIAMRSRACSLRDGCRPRAGVAHPPLVGITEELLADVTTTLRDARAAVLEHIDSSSVLVGHSLENDLRALKLAHPRVVDTAICYPHPTPPYKFGLRHLALEYLHRTIQVTTCC